MNVASTAPERTLSRLAAVFWIVWPVGIVVSILALVRSARAGRVSGLAVAGLVLSLAAVALTVVLLVFVVDGLGGLAERCAQLGPGDYSFDDGSSLSCG